MVKDIVNRNKWEKQNWLGIRGRGRPASFTVLLAWVLVGPVWAQSHTKGVPTRAPVVHQAPKRLGVTHPKQARELGVRETKCITYMLHAPSPAQAEVLKGKCTDSFTLRALYTSVLVKLHAPHADREVIKSLPTNVSQMDQLSSFSDAWSPDYATSLLQSQAYERYYHAIFRIVAARPELLPRFFAIAAQFGTDNPNVDEETWFCQLQERLYRRMPKTYMQAVKTTKDPYYRRVALDCRSGPL